MPAPYWQTMSRMPVLYVVRLCLPLMLVIILALYFFYVNDSYHQLDLSFNSLLVVTLMGIEVKDFMPDHVITVTVLSMCARDCESL